ncbi:MAG TPA: class I SAM-dependent methyltransferase [Thermodesulfobacteriota bacterium]|nr:class I SAM-dependent methyltransferase [Thermodesulfobacteriota bacterium]
MEEVLAREETHDWIVDALSKEKRGLLLDAPAGAGALASRLKKMGFSVSCCDIDPSLFSIRDIEIKRGDLSQSLPYPPGSFDFITCIEGLEHLENPFNAIREFHRILKTGGKLFLSLPNYLNIERRLRFLITGLFSKIPSPERSGKDRFNNLWMLHLTPLTYPLLKLALEHWGFNVVALEKDKEKKRMKWLLPVVWAIRLYCFFWPKETREKYHLKDTLSPILIMGGNTLIVVAQKREDGKAVLEK